MQTFSLQRCQLTASPRSQGNVCRWAIFWSFEAHIYQGNLPHSALNAASLKLKRKKNHWIVNSLLKVFLDTNNVSRVAAQEALLSAPCGLSLLGALVLGVGSCILPLQEAHKWQLSSPVKRGKLGSQDLAFPFLLRHGHTSIRSWDNLEITPISPTKAILLPRKCQTQQGEVRSPSRAVTALTLFAKFMAQHFQLCREFAAPKLFHWVHVALGTWMHCNPLLCNVFRNTDPRLRRLPD